MLLGTALLKQLTILFLSWRQLARNSRDMIWFTDTLWHYPLLPLSVLYALCIKLRCHLYRWQLFASWQPPIPVIVIGNLTVGGSGKTPLVIWLVQQLQQQGLQVGVISRGYGGNYGGQAQLVYQDSLPQEVGDEPVLIVQRTGVPMAVAIRRSQAVERLLQHYPLDLIISDDGLQHYGLQRQLEWLVIDGKRRFGNGHLLPAGPLREGLEKIGSVDALIVNGGDPQPSEHLMQLQFQQAVNLLTNETVPLNTLSTATVAMAGIADPQRFFAQLTQHGVNLQQKIAFADHQSYQLAMLQSLTPAEQPLLMTEKDAVKCRAFAQANWWYCPVETHLSAASTMLLINQVLDKIADGTTTI
ncbi:MAG: tetraacyldisaccharide 4'-kinase [Candidatus Symbiodolus clandestinus]